MVQLWCTVLALLASARAFAPARQRAFIAPRTVASVASSVAPADSEAAPSLVDSGRLVEVTLDEGLGSRYAFHAMWLRDACRDDAHVVADAGERLLTATPVGPLAYVDPSALAATSAAVVDGELVVEWNDASPTVRASRLPLELLREYAPVVATRAPSASGDDASAAADAPRPSWASRHRWHEWLEPFTGFPDARAQRADEIAPYYGDARADEDDAAWPPRFDHADVMSDDDGGATHLALLRALFRHGAVLVRGVPTDDDNSDGAARDLHAFVDRAVGGLQKDPTRAEANWKVRLAPRDSASFRSSLLFSHPHLRLDSSIFQCFVSVC